MPADKVIVAMSGGVDSSVAAALLVEQGFEVVGVMLRLWSELAPGLESTNRCCSLEAVDSARSVAYSLGVPFYLVNAEAQFKAEVVDDFIAEYGRGRTPNPCVVCNRRVRFGYLLDYGRVLGARWLATGHYARIDTGDAGSLRLLRGVDSAKDQSYVLHCLTPQQLARLRFPLGGLTKAEVRRIAADRGLTSAERAESQDLCFAADGDYRRFLQHWAPGAAIPGAVVDSAGRVLGQHQGLAFHTVGQRRGLGIASAEPLYVLRLCTDTNTVVVGGRDELAVGRLSAGGVNWVSGEAPPGPVRAEVQVRYHAEPVPATITPDGQGALVHFDRPVCAVAPGQSAVFYDGETCLGGGSIDETDSGEC